MTIDRLTMHEMKVRRITIANGYASVDRKQKDAYWYKKEGYEGDGTVVYQDSRHKWHIDDLTHCSCSGPCDGFCSTSYSLSDIKKLLKKEDYYENGGKEILSYLDGKRF